MGPLKSLRRYQEALQLLAPLATRPTAGVCRQCLTDCGPLVSERYASTSKTKFRTLQDLGQTRPTSSSVRRIQVEKKEKKRKPYTAEDRKTAAPLIISGEQPKAHLQDNKQTVKYLMQLAKTARKPAFGRKQDHLVFLPSADLRDTNYKHRDPAYRQAYLMPRLAYNLHQRHITNLVSVLMEPDADHTFFAMIPKTTWTEVLRLLDSKYHSYPTHKIHRSFSRNRLSSTGSSYVKNREFLTDKVINIIRIRRDHGITMDLRDYQMVLRYTARRGDPELTKAIWSDMKKEGVSPDVSCFNALMESIVWDEDARIQLKSRARPRRRELGSAAPAIFRGGASDEVRPIWEEMLRERHVPDRDSYCIYMAALGRDGYLAEVEAILAQAFHIDVHALTSEAPGATWKRSRGPPMEPNNKLLVSTVEVFGAANRIPTALAIIDYVSSTCGVKVSHNVWYKLAQWTWMQARVRRGDRTGHDVGNQMHLENVQALGEMMVETPYNVTPSIELLDILLRSSGVATDEEGATPRFPRMLQLMEHGRLEYIRLVQKSRRLEELNRAFDHANKVKHFSTRGAIRGRRLRHQLDSVNLKKRLAQMTLKRWARKITLLKGIDFHDGPQKPEFDRWRTLGLPNFILRWNVFLPDVVKYRIDSGMVELQFRTKEDRRDRYVYRGVSKNRRKRPFVWKEARNRSTPWDVEAGIRVTRFPRNRRSVGKAARKIMPPEPVEISRKGTGMFEPSYTP